LAILAHTDVLRASFELLPLGFVGVEFVGVEFVGVKHFSHAVVIFLSLLFLSAFARNMLASVIWTFPTLD
jgi:hypothetical protein